MTETRHNFPEIMLGGFRTIVASREELAGLMLRDCMLQREADTKSEPKLVFSSNGQGVALAAQNADFARVMAAAEITHADGMAAVWISRLVSRVPLPERVATTDFFHDAAREAERHGLAFYFLGGSPDQNARAVAAARRLYPRLIIAGARDGYFKDSETEQVCEEIVASGTDVLWVALGKPKQEFWSVANRHRLQGVGWIKTCGGLYAFLAGDAPRAPDWMQYLSLEWFWRLMQEPRRLGMRYLRTNPVALWVLLTRSQS